MLMKPTNSRENGGTQKKFSSKSPQRWERTLQNRKDRVVISAGKNAFENASFSHVTG